MASLDPYPLQAWSLLDAVNICLRTIGQINVLMLDSASLTADAESALKTIHDVSINRQTEGWQWNTDWGMALPAWPQDGSAAAGTVKLPFNTLKVLALNATTGRNYTQRGQLVYDAYANSYNIGTTIYADIISALDFETLPQAARAVIAMEAARIFAGGKLNNTITNQFTEEMYQQSLFRLYEAEDLNDDLNWTEKNAYLLGRHRHRRYTS